jgi:hypothetical protein
MLGESSSTIVNVCVRSFGLSACRVITLRPAGMFPIPTERLIQRRPWRSLPPMRGAVLVSCTDEARLASHIPVILYREGEPGATLLGHLARANRHLRLLSRSGRFSKPKLVTIGPELGPEQA